MTGVASETAPIESNLRDKEMLKICALNEDDSSRDSGGADRVDEPVRTKEAEVCH